MQQAKLIQNALNSNLSSDWIVKLDHKGLPYYGKRNKNHKYLTHKKDFEKI